MTNVLNKYFQTKNEILACAVDWFGLVGVLYGIRSKKGHKAPDTK